MKDLWKYMSNREYTEERYALEMMIKDADRRIFAPDPHDFEESVEGLQQFLEALGCDEFLSAEECTRPNHPNIAYEYGYTEFVPPKGAWYAFGVLAIIFDMARRIAGSPIHVRNAYRPEEYNADVGGAKSSDHISPNGVCLAFDMDFKSHEDRKKVDAYVERLYDLDWLELSIGKGNAMYHLGVLNRRRRWSYK